MEYSPIALALLNQATDTRLPRDKPGLGATLSDMMLQQAQQQSTQADADAKRYALNEERRTQEMLKGMDLSDPALPKKLLSRGEPILAAKVMQMQAKAAPSSTIGKIQADIDAGLIDPATGAAALKKATTIPPVYDPVNETWIYPSEGYAAPQANQPQPTITQPMQPPAEAQGEADILPPPSWMKPSEKKAWVNKQSDQFLKKRTELEESLPNTVASADYLYQVLDDIDKDPAKSAVVGIPDITQGAIPFFGNMKGTPAAGFEQKLNQVQGAQFLQAYNTLKGGGQISVVEGTKAENAIARMNAAQSEEDFDKALDEFKDVISQARNRSLKLGKKYKIDLPKERQTFGKKYQEGQTATGSNGQKLVYTNGKWRAQ